MPDHGNRGEHLVIRKAHHAHRTVLLIGHIDPASVAQNGECRRPIADRNRNRLAKQRRVIAELIEARIDDGDGVGIVIGRDQLRRRREIVGKNRARH